MISAILILLQKGGEKIVVNKLELKAEMIRIGVSASDLGRALRVSQVTINKRLNGKLPWSTNEVKVVALMLGLTLEQVNVIFFDNQLPNGNSSPAETP